MINRITISLLLLLSVVVQAQEKLHITGNIEGIDNETKLRLSGEGAEQEFYLKDGKIDVSMTLQETPSSVYLDVFKNDGIKYTSFFLGNEEVTLEGSIDDFGGNLKAIGSIYDDLRYENYLLTKEFEDEIKQLDIDKKSLAEKELLTDSVKKQANNKWNDIMYRRAQKEFGFILENINSDYGRFLLRFTTDNYTAEQYKILLDAVDPMFNDKKEVQYLKALAESKPLELGDKYYDFKAEDINGNAVKFSEYFDGKYVMLDFSNVNCGFCYMAAPKTAELAEDLKDKLVYITYHTGDNRIDAEEYYKHKGSKGNIIWNKEGDYSKVIAMYRNTRTPAYLLFNPEGVFLGKFVGTNIDLKKSILDVMSN